jgi:hypothetical protein
MSPYTSLELMAWEESFHRRISAKDPSAFWEYALWLRVVKP